MPRKKKPLEAQRLLTLADVRAALKERARGKRRGKYNARKTEFMGVVFDSKHEAEEYAKLHARLQAGEISNLRRQVSYNLIVNGQLICRYVADFVYIDASNKEIVADAKGVRTPTYRLKRKLMKAIHGIDILEL